MDLMASAIQGLPPISKGLSGLLSFNRDSLGRESELRRLLPHGSSSSIGSAGHPKGHPGGGAHGMMLSSEASSGYSTSSTLHSSPNPSPLRPNKEAPKVLLGSGSKSSSFSSHRSGSLDGGLAGANGGGSNNSSSSGSERSWSQDEIPAALLRQPIMNGLGMLNGGLASQAQKRNSSMRPGSLDANLVILRKEMVSLRQMDMTLLNELWHLRDQIQALKHQRDSGPSSSTTASALKSVQEEGLESRILASGQPSWDGAELDSDSESEDEFYTSPVDNSRDPGLPGPSVVQAINPQIKDFNYHSHGSYPYPSGNPGASEGSELRREEHSEHLYSNLSSQPNRRLQLNSSGAKRRLPERPIQPSVLMELGPRSNMTQPTPGRNNRHFLYDTDNDF